MKSKLNDILASVIYAIIAILGLIVIFLVIIPFGGDVIYPTFGFIIAIGFIAIASWFFMTCLFMITILIAEMFFKK